MVPCICYKQLIEIRIENLRTGILKKRFQNEIVVNKYNSLKKEYTEILF